MTNKHIDQNELLIDGNIYSIKHLKDFTYRYETNKYIYNLLIHFSCHCFSDDKLKFFNKLKFSCSNHKNLSEIRGFCSTRYKESLNLKNFIIKMLDGGKVYFTDKQNYMTIPNTDYVIYFTLTNKIENKNQLFLFVQSAYVKKNIKRDKNLMIPLQVLIEKTYRNETIVHPKYFKK